MNSYTFYTIHTVIDIGDGSTSTIVDGKFTGAMNLCRIVESVMMYHHPMMVSVTKALVDLSKPTNATFYNLPRVWGECVVSTFKFAIPMDVTISLNGIPLVLPVEVNGKRLTKFNNTTSERNLSISKQTFSST